jgi:hypothetical protein
MDDVDRPKEVREKLDKYFEFIREDKAEKATELRQELEQLLGTDEPELLKADILIRKKLRAGIKHETN